MASPFALFFGRHLLRQPRILECEDPVRAVFEIWGSRFRARDQSIRVARLCKSGILGQRRESSFDSITQAQAQYKLSHFALSMSAFETRRPSADAPNYRPSKCCIPC